MSDAKTTPSMIRHEGAHRVTLTSDGRKAVSRPHVIAGAKQRPDSEFGAGGLKARVVVASEPAVERSRAAAQAPDVSLSAAVLATELLRRFLPSLPDVQDPAAQEARMSALQQRMDRLAQANAEVSTKVCALERDLQPAVNPPRSTP